MLNPPKQHQGHQYEQPKGDDFYAGESWEVLAFMHLLDQAVCFRAWKKKCGFCYGQSRGVAQSRLQDIALKCSIWIGDDELGRLWREGGECPNIKPQPVEDILKGTSGNLISPGNAFAEHNREPSKG